MKPLFNFHSLDVECIKERLNDLDFRIYLLELSHSGADKHIYGKTILHSKVIQQVAHRINSIEFLPGDKHSITINIELK